MTFLFFVYFILFFFGGGGETWSTHGCDAPISLRLGISCPRPGRAGEADEPFSQEALAFTKAFCMQREVTLDIEDVDKRGSFVGHVYLKGKNLSEALLNEGLAKLHFSADRYKNYGVVAAAEASARERKCNIWLNFKEEEVVAQEAVPEKKERSSKYEEVVVTEISDGVTFWAQPVENGKPCACGVAPEPVLCARTVCPLDTLVMVCRGFLVCQNTAGFGHGDGYSRTTL